MEKKYTVKDLIEMMWMDEYFEKRVEKGWNAVYTCIKFGERNKNLDYWADVIIRDDEKKQSEMEFKDLVMGMDDDDGNPPF